MTNRQIPDRFLHTTNIIDTTFAVNFFMQFELTFRLKLKCARYGKKPNSIEYRELFAIKHTGCTVYYQIISFYAYKLIRWICIKKWYNHMKKLLVNILRLIWRVNKRYNQLLKLVFSKISYMRNPFIHSWKHGNKLHENMFIDVLLLFEISFSYRLIVLLT